MDETLGRIKIKLTLAYSDASEKARENPQNARLEGIADGLDMALEILNQELKREG